jgi:hypothetical protein
VLQAGVSTGLFVLPLALEQKQLINKDTEVVVSKEEAAIINDMRPGRIKGEVAAATVLVFKLL